MDPTLFADDLARKPEVLGRLADRLVADPDPWHGFATQAPPPHLVLIGMGSSYFAAAVAAARLRAAGVDAVAERAGSGLLPRPREGTRVVAVSAGGGSRETRWAVGRYHGHCPVALLTNTPDSPMAGEVDLVVPMHAETEVGGVACRSYLHTLVLLLALERGLTRSPVDLVGTLRRSAGAIADLQDRVGEWWDPVTELIAGRDGTYVVAPARRLCSAEQSALMLREGPRRAAVACETGDWSHVDVYLTKTLDYRMLLLAGSRWQDELLRWTAERGSTVVAVGADVDGAAYSLRYAGDEDDDVRLLAETTVAEQVAAGLWADATPAPAEPG
ncbi:MAG: SIS domain-containing protein [Candidatus Nanopelagicales bacterium]